MASSTPSTPVMRRSVSLPVTKSASTPDPQIEVLFNLPYARVISFTTENPNARPSSSNGSPVVEEEPGTLSWTSRFERTIAVGPLRIYRAPGSVAFLSCSNALKPILPKSQCWEVDGSGKFVLQMRKPQYWRIEVPNKTNVGQSQVEELKDIFAKVLLFEKTPCPFKRNFTVELPQAPVTPVKKKPWRPVERPKLDVSPLTKAKEEEEGHFGVDKSEPMSLTDSSGPESQNISTTVTASQLEEILSVATIIPLPTIPDSEGDEDSRVEYKTEKTSPIPEREDVTEDSISLEAPAELVEESSPEPSLEDDTLEESVFNAYHGIEEDENFSDATDDTNITPRSQLQPAFQSMTLDPEKETRPQALQSCSRSVTAPPVLSLVTSPPSKQRKKSPLRSSTLAETDSDFSSSVDSFHSVQSWHSPLAPPSPPASGNSSPSATYPYPHDNIVLPKRLNHTREVSELTVTPETPRTWVLSPVPDMNNYSRSLSPPPKTPTLVHDGSEKSDEGKFEIITPPTLPNVRHRGTTSSNSRRRALSPLPAAVNLFSPPRRRTRRLQTARHLPTAIIQKTCEILLSPPSHLFQLMLNIASKIAAGEWRGMLSGYGEAVHWDFEDEYAGEGWVEDDYGISLAKTSSKTAINRNNHVSGGSWEVD